MPEIKILNSNNILPSITFDNISIDYGSDNAGNTRKNLINVDSIVKVSLYNNSLDKQIDDKQYLKYVGIYTIITTNNVEQQELENVILESDIGNFTDNLNENLLNKVNNANILYVVDSANIQDKQTEYFLRVNDSTAINANNDSLTLNIVTFFNVNKYIIDNNLNNENEDVLKSVFGQQVAYTYPLTENNNVYNVLTFNNTQVDSVVKDLREVTFLNNKNLSYPFRKLEESILKSNTNEYSKIFITTNYKDLIRGYVYFKYNNFIKDKSFFDNNANDLPINLKIFRIDNNNENNKILIDNVILNKQQLETNKNNTFLVGNYDKSILLYFEDNVAQFISKSNFKYELNYTYVDKSFYSLYEPYNKTGLYFRLISVYEKLKNTILLAYKKAYSVSEINIRKLEEPSYNPQVFLNTDTDTFTDSYIQFYSQQNINLNQFINSFIEMLNQFLKQPEKVTEKEKREILKSLIIRNSTMKSYTKFFTVVDNLFYQIELLLANVKQTISEYKKVSDEFNFIKDGSYFTLLPYSVSKNYPIVRKGSITDLYKTLKKNWLFPTTFTSNNVRQRIPISELATDKAPDVDSSSQLYKDIMSKAKKDIIVEQEYGCTFQFYNSTEVAKIDDRKKQNFQTNNKSYDSYDSKALEIKKNQYKNFSDNKAPKDLKTKEQIIDFNELIDTILFSDEVLEFKINTNHIAPAIVLYNFNFEDGSWKPITKLEDFQKLTRKSFIKAEISDSITKNIFKNVQIDPNLETSFFITE